MFSLILISLLSWVCGAVTVSQWDDWSHLRIKTDDPSVTIHARYFGTGPPVLLVHGNPQHSLSWSTIGPIIASHNYTVICPDNRGAGDSSIPANGDYSASTHADDLKALLSYLNINQTYVLSHDKGVGIATAFAAKYSNYVKKLGLSEYALPGFGYENFWSPGSAGGWDLYQNWQLGFFSVPDAAQFFIQGREREMLAWYFYHSSYSGNEAISQDHLNRYATSISKPGFLRSMLNIFSVATVSADAKFFNNTFNVQGRKLQMPVLALGGEASIAGTEVLTQLFGPVASDLTTDNVPKAGHWILDENPKWVADRYLKFIKENASDIPVVDLSWLDDKLTLIEQ